MLRTLSVIFSPPTSKVAIRAVHDLAWPSPAPPTRPAGVRSRSSIPERFATSSETDVRGAPVSSRATAFPRMQGRRDDRGLAGPVGEVGVVALALRKAQPHRTVRQVVFGIRQR